MTHRLSLLALLAFLAVWFALAGGGGCDTQPPQQTNACPGTSAQTASTGTTSYTIGSNLNADGVTWTPSYSVGDPAITIAGSDGDRCMHLGGVFGPIPSAAVYECSSEGCAAGTSVHCPGSNGTSCATCPTPCFEYHTSEAVEHERTSDTLYQNFCARRYGDGISATEDAGGIMCKGCYFAQLHDDPIEHDWCKSIVVQDTLMEQVFMATATNPRAQDEVDCTGATVSILASKIKFGVFQNSYKERPGHGGLYKTTAGNSPKRVLKASHIMFGPVVGDGQEMIPPPSLFAQTSDCSGNTFYFRGDATQKAAFLADEDGIDGLTNEERLDALDYCITVIWRDAATETDFDFVLGNWSDLSSDWTYNHAADDGC